MPLILLALFIGIPILEIAVFVQVGDRIGLWPTLGTVILTAVVGTALLRHQGFTVLNRARATLDRGEMPLVEVFDGLCLLVAGALLLTPGFVTDAIGFILTIPPLRTALMGGLAAWLIKSGRLRMATSGAPPGQGGPRPGGPGPVIDGDFEVVEDDEKNDLRR
ncbi:MAG: FxsA family protein [Magnetospiraceae bacterium]